jgi:predicted membrane protein
MRSEYDMIEDARLVKTSKLFNRRALICIIAMMLFLISCGIFFNTTYLYAMKQIEIQQKEEDELAQSKKDASRKTYYIEQRIREDLKKMLQQGK